MYVSSNCLEYLNVRCLKLKYNVAKVAIFSVTCWNLGSSALKLLVLYKKLPFLAINAKNEIKMDESVKNANFGFFKFSGSILERTSGNTGSSRGGGWYGIRTKNGSETIF